MVSNFNSSLRICSLIYAMAEIPVPKCGSLTLRHCVEVTVACVMIGVVWGLLLLPTVFYYLPQVSDN